MMFENRCVICNTIIPEGRWVCPTCERKAMYECDPDKNTECRKTNCYINGGECHLTARAEFQRTLQIYLDDGAYPPVRAHKTDAGLDIRSKDEQIVSAKDSAIFHTGVHVRLPRGTAGVLISKSGLNVNHDITSTGLIDETYSGEIVIKLYNHGGYDYKVNAGDKISQLVILPVMTPEVDIVDRAKYCELWEETERGSDGFGSSGK